MSPPIGSVHALKWSAIDAFLRQGVQFCVAVILARLLTPEDFGIVAMLYLFSALATLFVDCGLGAALIQQQVSSLEEESTAFYFNIFMATAMAACLVFASSWIGDFFSQPILNDIIYVYACNIVVGAFALIQQTLLVREMQFKILAKAGTIGSLFSGLTAIGLAYLGFGVWCLAWQALISTVISTILLWRWHQWRPAPVFHPRTLKRHFRFGGFLLFSGVLDVCFTQIHGVLIGKLFSAADTGFYSRALNTRQMPLGLLESIFSRVMFPIFSKANGDRERLAADLKKSLMTMMFINVPTMIGMIVTAEPLVELLFGSKWLPCAPILQVLCLAGLFWPLHTANLNVLMALGRSDLFFRLEVLKKLFGIASLLVAAPFGVMTIAWSLVVTSFVCIFVNGYYSGGLLGYGVLRQLMDLLPNLGIGLGLALVFWIVRPMVSLNTLGELLLVIGIGGPCYLLIAKQTRGFQVIDDAWSYFRNAVDRTP